MVRNRLQNYSLNGIYSPDPVSKQTPNQQDENQLLALKGESLHEIPSFRHDRVTGKIENSFNRVHDCISALDEFAISGQIEQFDPENSQQLEHGKQLNRRTIDSFHVPGKNSIQFPAGSGSGSTCDFIFQNVFLSEKTDIFRLQKNENSIMNAWELDRRRPKKTDQRLPEFHPGILARSRLLFIPESGWAVSYLPTGNRTGCKVV